MLYKEIKKNELVKYLKSDSDISFYHLVKINLSAGYGENKFVREESQFEDKQGVYETWVQGLYHLPEDERSFISIVYNEFETKYSIHVRTSLIASTEEPFVKIEVENRDIFLEIGLHKLENENRIRLSEPPSSTGELDGFINAITQHGDFISAFYSDSLRTELLSKAELVIGKISLTENRIIEGHLKNIISRLIKFLYPTSWNSQLQYSIFIVPGYASGAKEQTSGGVATFFKPIGFTGLFRKKIESISNKTALWSNIETVDSLLSIVMSHARKAAIAQVMLRNMSHNHGSHVLANLTQPQTILEMVFMNTHDDLTDNERYLADANKLTFINSDNREIKVNSKPTSFNIAIAELSSYMRTRMDFLADISTGTAVIETNKKLGNDVVDPFQERAILLKKYITGNEKKVSINNPNGSILSAFPNDNLGVQAFYVIIENVIRNSAKHSKSNKDVVINWKSDPNTYLGLTELIIYDKNDQKDPSELDSLVNAQNERIQKDMLENGALRHGSWGTLEMKIAAAYLRKEPVERIDEFFAAPLLTAVSVPEKDGKCLGYKFYLLKPKQVLVVIKTNPESIKVSEEFFKNGIKFISLSDLCQSKETFGHDIVLLAGCNESEIYSVRKRLSSRIISMDLETLKPQMNGPHQSTDLINWAWEAWFKKLIKETNPVTVVKIDDANGDNLNTVELFNKNKNNSTVAMFVYHSKTFRENNGYFEPYGSLHPANKQISELTNSSLFDLKGRFLETINYIVAIADERIQKHCDTMFDGGNVNCTKKHSDFLEKCGVILPPIEIDLNAKSFDKKIGKVESGKTIKQLLMKWCEEQATKCNFLVIHIGLIERLLELDTVKDEYKQKKIEEYLSYLRKTQGRKARFIITSGRGQPESLPKGERFIHYSNIAQYVIEKRSKFHLIQLLMSARETK